MQGYKLSERFRSFVKCARCGHESSVLQGFRMMSPPYVPPAERIAWCLPCVAEAARVVFKGGAR